MDYLRYDMHCHTLEGSTDAHYSIFDYIKKLKGMGFGGMLVTDHDSYDGYDSLMVEQLKDDSFHVLKGIEYDTFDFGHFIVIMPEGKIPKELYFRGMKLRNLINVVHENGGILGPAHPCGEPFLSFYATGIRYNHATKMKELLPLMDFIEGYNASEDSVSNRTARALARKYNRPMTGGSDAHKEDCVGLGYAFLPAFIKNNNDLIKYIKTNPNIMIGGKRYGKTLKDKLGPFNKLLVAGFYPYNKFEALLSLFKKGFK